MKPFELQEKKRIAKIYAIQDNSEEFGFTTPYNMSQPLKKDCHGTEQKLALILNTC